MSTVSLIDEETPGKSISLHTRNVLKSSERYPAWKNYMLMLIKSYKWLDFIMKDQPDHRNDLLCRMVILDALDIQLQDKLNSCTSSFKLWQGIADLMEKPSAQESINIYSKLTRSTYVYSSIRTIKNHIDELIQLRERLLILDPISTPSDEAFKKIIISSLNFNHFAPILCTIQEQMKEMTINQISLRLQDYEERSGRSKPSSTPSINLPVAMATTKKNKKKNNKTQSQQIPFAMMTSGVNSSITDQYILDSAATHHLTSKKELLEDFIEEESFIRTAGDTKLKSKGFGTLLLTVLTPNGEENKVRFNNVIYVPSLKTNLISLPALLKKGFNLVGDATRMIIRKNSQVIFEAKELNNLYHINTKITTCYLTDANLWHRRCSHVNMQDLIKAKGLTLGMEFKDEKEFDCKNCNVSKTTKKPSHEASQRATEILELLHMDITGEIREDNVNDWNYALIIVDDKSRFTISRLVSSKSQVPQEVIKSMKYLERKYNKKIKKIRSDNGSEFLASELQEFLTESGIISQRTVPYTAHQNGTAERRIRTLSEAVTVNLLQANLQRRYWGYAWLYATHTLNRLPTTANDNSSSPYEILNKRKPKISYFRPFGCLCFAQAENLKKFQPRAYECLFLGYPYNVKGYTVINRTTLKIYNSESPKFSENVFPGLPSDLSEIDDSHQILTENVSSDSINTNDVESLAQGPVNSLIEVHEAPNVNHQEDFRRSSRTKRVPDRLIFEQKLGDVLNINPRALLASVQTTEEPTSYKDAMKYPDSIKWHQACIEELRSHEENETWHLVEPPLNRKIIPSKWVFKIKRDENNNISKFKARLVICGNMQVEGIDYELFSSPTSRISTLRALLSLKWKNIKQYDISTAYLNGLIDKEIYMLQPPGFEDNSGKVCKLKKSLYGLRQAGRIWNEHLHTTLVEFSLTQSAAERCVYYKDNTVVLIYVDDIVIFTNKSTEEFKDFLQGKYKLTKLGKLHFILGIGISFENDQVIMNQHAYIKNICNTFNDGKKRRCSTPILQKFYPEPVNNDDEIHEIKKYQSLLGSLMYLSICTRPDISFSVSLLSKFISRPSIKHHDLLMNLLDYISKTIHLNLILSPRDSVDIRAYSDSDWASDIDRKSISGFVIFNGDSLINYESKKQNLVATSTYEAEYIGLASAAKDCIYWVSFYETIGYKVAPPVIHCDNQSAIYAAHGQSTHSKAKHIDVRYHFIKDLVAKERIKVEFIPSSGQIADLFTKSLERKSHFLLVESLNLQGVKGLGWVSDVPILNP